MEPLCNSLDIPFEQNHRAASDSDACAKVMLKCLDKLQVNSFEELEHKINIRRGCYKGDLHNGQKSLTKAIGKSKKYSNNANPDNFDEDNYFYGKEVLFTGEMKYGNREKMRALIDNIGGHSIDSFKKSVDVLVEGVQKASNLTADGKSRKQIKNVRSCLLMEAQLRFCLKASSMNVLAFGTNNKLNSFMWKKLLLMLLPQFGIK